MITDKDIEILLRQDNLTLANWWCELNCWGWPDGLPDPISDEERHEIIKKDRENDRAWEIMQWIDKRVGHRYVLYASNVLIKKTMTDQEFNDFWNGMHEGCVESKKRYEKRINEMFKEGEVDDS